MYMYNCTCMYNYNVQCTYIIHICIITMYNVIQCGVYNNYSEATGREIPRQILRHGSEYQIALSTLLYLLVLLLLLVLALVLVLVHHHQRHHQLVHHQHHPHHLKVLRHRLEYQIASIHTTLPSCTCTCTCTCVFIVHHHLPLFLFSLFTEPHFTSMKTTMVVLHCSLCHCKA